VQPCIDIYWFIEIFLYKIGPNITYGMKLISIFRVLPRISHLVVVKRILRCMKSNLGYKLFSKHI